ncbi:hypothetical protein KP509_27G038600 [Ceratopteris richardii]|uniref:Bifunctional inhibitor/plant lipid transfer protein/seed storage helical domain-containing protein n=1 Tax=Ceratopteris richardii TaxID=49495 RepID=A0A8T2RFH1_CERRI|nr:hypothetical protein KP509_27G038600 [Ceratopteris richardii]
MAALHMGNIVAVALFFSALATLGDVCGTSRSGTTTWLVNIIELSVCSPLLGGILGVPHGDCCALLDLIGLDVEICLCLTIEANVLGIINIDIPTLDIVARIMTACVQILPSNLTCTPRFFEKAPVSFPFSL